MEVERTKGMSFFATNAKIQEHGKRKRLGTRLLAKLQILNPRQNVVTTIMFVEYNAIEILVTFNTLF